MLFSSFSKWFLSILALLLILFLAIYFIPWRQVTWGKIQTESAPTITVIGQAETQQKNQVATFTAGVDAVNDNKDTAVAEVNQKIAAMTESVKSFGIKPEDIQTQNLSIYRGEEMFSEGGVQKSRPGQWRVNNSITIKLRELDKASALADLLASSGATNVYGPNFALDDTKNAQTELFQKAIEDARTKATTMASYSGKQLGGIVSITEGTPTPGVSPMYDKFGAGGGAGAALEPGSGTVQATVTVIFELK